MKKDQEIITVIEEEMIKQGICRKELADLVKRHKSTISKFFNRNMQTRSKYLMIEILKVLNIGFIFKNRELILLHNVDDIEKQKYKEWINQCGVHEFCEQKYNIIKSILIEI
jgi:hypothetical protein